VELLANVSDVDDAVCHLNFGAVSYRSHVSSVIIKSSVTLTNDEWDLLFWNKHTNGAIAFNGDLFLNQLLNKRL
jgi:hypothetical protein